MAWTKRTAWLTVATAIIVVLAPAPWWAAANAQTLALSMTGQPQEFEMRFEPAVIEGFDGVRLGMTMAEVEARVAERYPDAPIEWAIDPVNLTPVIHVMLEALAPVPGAPAVGPATITYVFGAHTQELMAINVNWYALDEPTPEERAAILAVGTAYVADLLGYVWTPLSVFRGVVTGPNEVVLMSAQDVDGRVVEVRASGVPLDVLVLPGEVEEHRPVTDGPARLRISVVASADNPDVLAIQPGDF